MLLTLVGRVGEVRDAQDRELALGRREVGAAEQRSAELEERTQARGQGRHGAEHIQGRQRAEDLARLGRELGVARERQCVGHAAQSRRSPRRRPSPGARTLGPVLKYLGSKRELVPLIGELVRRIPARTACDLFAGTTRVGQELRRSGLVVHSNDTATYSEALGQAYIAADEREPGPGPPAGAARRALRPARPVMGT